MKEPKQHDVHSLWDEICQADTSIKNHIRSVAFMAGFITSSILIMSMLLISKYVL